MSAETAKILEHDWALDPLAASVIADRLPAEGEQHIAKIAESLGPVAVAARDLNREVVSDILASRSEMMWLTIGLCSLDTGVEYGSLHDLRSEVAAANPGWLTAERLNGDKPRTSTKWRGLLNSTDPADRRRVFQIMHEALTHGIPIFSEVTDPSHLGNIAPYSTGVWIGARDMESSHLREALSSVSGMPVAVKNGSSGNPKDLQNAIPKIRSSADDNEGSGINWGSIGSTDDHIGFPTGIVPVGVGNQHVAIIGRGYTLPDNLTPAEREAAAYEHISSLCDVAAQENTIVKLDINRGSPKMFNLGTNEDDRPFKVIQRVSQGIRSGKITNADRIRGFMCEIGPVEGRTDPNWVIDLDTAQRLGEMMFTLTDALKSVK